MGLAEMLGTLATSLMIQVLWPLKHGHTAIPRTRLFQDNSISSLCSHRLVRVMCPGAQNPFPINLLLS